MITTFPLKSTLLAATLLCLLLRHRTKHQGIAVVEAAIHRKNYSPLLPIKRKSFHWKASLNGNTGVASSLEQSIFQYKLTTHGEETSFSNNRQIHEFAQKIFAAYPAYLQHPSLTLGLCQTVPSSSSSMVQQHGHILQTSSSLFLPPPLKKNALLIFGQPNDVTLSMKHRHGTNLILIQSERSKGKFIDEGCGGEVLCCIEIPIVGGLLAITSDQTNYQKIKKKKNDDFGCLRFTWLRLKNNHQKEEMHLQQQQHKQKQKQQHCKEVVLITEIAGQYRPALAGSIIPIPSWRNALYCYTQRMVHAYVMWRFHGHVMKEYSNIALSS